MKYKIKLKGTNPKNIAGKLMFPGEEAIVNAKHVDRSDIRISILDTISDKKQNKKEDKKDGFMESEGSNDTDRRPDSEC